MATNRLPDALADLFVLGADAFAGAESIGDSVPLLINIAELIGAELQAAQSAQLEYKTARAKIDPLATALRTEREAAYAFCFTARDLLRVFCGRGWNEGWLAVGFANGLEVPRSYAGLRELLAALAHHFTLHPEHELPAVGVTAALAESRLNAMKSAHEAVNSQWARIEEKLQARDAAVAALRKRLSGLNKELSMRLGDMDPRWIAFGFNQPGAPTSPAVPEDVVVTPLAEARLQVECEASPGATGYRFYVQRPEIDPEPVAAGRSPAPLFVTDPLVPGTEYLVYVSAVNEGAESDLSTAVSAKTRVVLGTPLGHQIRQAFLPSA